MWVIFCTLITALNAWAYEETGSPVSFGCAVFAALMTLDAIVNGD